MKTKTEAIKDIERYLVKMNDYSDGLSRFPKEDMGFLVADTIVEHNDVSFLNLVPSEVKKEVFEIAKSYREHGRYGIISNIGNANHTEMARTLSALLSESNIF